MKIALTEATGFLGRYIVRHLAEAGLHLRCWYRPSSDRSGFDGARLPRLALVNGDVDVHAADAGRAELGHFVVEPHLAFVDQLRSRQGAVPRQRRKVNRKTLSRRSYLLYRANSTSAMPGVRRHRRQSTTWRLKALFQRW